jgi:PAS domain S-box-containing protein
MAFNFATQQIPFAIMGILVLVIGVVVWNRKSSPGATPMTICLTAIAFWIFSRTLMISAVNFEDKVLWAIIMFFCIATSSIAWLYFCFEFSGYWDIKKRKYIIFLYILPVFSAIIVLVRPEFQINWLDTKPILSNGSIIWQKTFLFWLTWIYLFSLALIGTGALIRSGLRGPSIRSRQVLILTAGTVIAIFGIAINGLGYNRNGNLDFLPYLFVVAGMFYIITIFRLKILDVVPQARNVLIDNIPNGIIVVNTGGYVVDMNSATERILGAEKKNVLGNRLDKISPSMGFTNAGGDRVSEVITVNKKESTSYLDVRINSLIDQDLKLKGTLLIMTDITQRKKMEQELSENEIRYKTLVEQSRDGVLIVQDGNYVYANCAASEITGYSIEEILKKPKPFTIAREDNGLSETGISAMNRETEIIDDYYETRIRLKNGSQKEVEVTIGAITFNGRAAHMLTLRDISERKVTQRKLAILYAEEVKLRSSLQEEIDKRNKYTGAIVQELNTPLTAILKSSDLLESQVQETTHIALINNVRRAALNLEHRTNELLELTRGEIGALKISKVPVNIFDLIKEITEDIAPIAGSKGLDLQIQVTRDLPLVEGDKNILSQVLMNLLTNAIKFTAKGKILVKAYISDENYILVQVEDTGIGIDSLHMENLFDPYRRKPVGGMQFSGLGIGLALSKMYIELHEGKIWAESKFGQGSIFSFTIPIYRNHSESHSS